MPQTFLHSIDKFFGQIEVVKVGNRLFVRKKYTKELGIIKWFIIKSLSIPVKTFPFAFSPRERMRREIGFFDAMKAIVNTPKIIEVNWDELYTVREYIEGELPIVNSPHNLWEDIGQTLARVHNTGFALGDSKITNFIKSSTRGIYIIDGEQAIETENSIHRVWDLIVLVTTCIHTHILTAMSTFTWGEKKVFNNIKVMLRAYSDSGCHKILEIIREDSRAKILVHMLVPFPYNLRFLRIVRSVLESFT